MFWSVNSACKDQKSHLFILIYKWLMYFLCGAEGRKVELFS